MAVDWVRATLGEVANLTIGRTPPRNDPSFWTTDLTRPFCTIADMTGPSIRPVREGVTEKAERGGKAKRIPAGSLLMSFKLTVGRVGFAAADLFPNEAIVAISPDERVDAGYLALWLEHLDFAAMGQRAVKGKTLNQESLLAIRVDFPPLDEQRRIVDLVGRLSDQERAALRLAETTKAVARTVRSQHFRAAHTEASARADDLFEIVIGRQRTPRHASGPHMTPYLRAANVLDARLDLSDVKSMNFDLEEQERFKLRPGDVLVTEGCGSLREVGAAAAWHEDITNGPVCFQNTLLRVRARPGLAAPGYAEQWARYCYEAKVFASVASGTNIFHIGVGRAQSLPVVPTSLDEQDALVITAASLDSVSSSATEAVSRVRTLREGLIGQLLDGKLRIPLSYDRFLEVG